ncbi:Uncharacterised protein [Bordetella pertussis]|nr:Uncharacterised protein [Bordetella pertussis]
MWTLISVRFYRKRGRWRCQTGVWGNVNGPAWLAIRFAQGEKRPACAGPSYI